MRVIYQILFVLLLVSCGKLSDGEINENEIAGLKPLFWVKGEVDVDLLDHYPLERLNEINHPRLVLVWCYYGDFGFRDFLFQDLGPVSSESGYKFEKPMIESIPKEVMSTRFVTLGKIWLVNSKDPVNENFDMMPIERLDWSERFYALKEKEEHLLNRVHQMSSRNKDLGFEWTPGKIKLEEGTLTFPDSIPEAESIGLLARALRLPSKWESFALGRGQKDITNYKCEGSAERECLLSVNLKWQRLKEEWTLLEEYFELLLQMRKMKIEINTKLDGWNQYFFDMSKAWLIGSGIQHQILVIPTEDEYYNALNALEAGSFQIRELEEKKTGFLHVSCNYYDCSILDTVPTIKIYPAYEWAHLQTPLHMENPLQIQSEFEVMEPKEFQGLYRSATGSFDLHVQVLDSQGILLLDSAWLRNNQLPIYGAIPIQSIVKNGELFEFNTFLERLRITGIPLSNGAFKIQVAKDEGLPTNFIFEAEEKTFPIHTIQFDESFTPGFCPEQIFLLGGEELYFYQNEAGECHLVSSYLGITQLPFLEKEGVLYAEGGTFQLSPLFEGEDLIALEVQIGGGRALAIEATYRWKGEDSYFDVPPRESKTFINILSGTGREIAKEGMDCFDSFYWGETEMIQRGGLQEWRVLTTFSPGKIYRFEADFCQSMALSGHDVFLVLELKNPEGGKLRVGPKKIFEKNQNIRYTLEAFNVQSEMNELKMIFLPNDFSGERVNVDFLELSEDNFEF